MRTLLKDALVINVFTDEILRQSVLIEDDTIIGVGDYDDADADVVRDIKGKYLCPGFIDGHIHVESTQLLPSELAKACLMHGTTSIVTDPHEIANVCGIDGIKFMLQASQDLPVTNYVMLPSCVPSCDFDEPGATILAADLKDLYKNDRILGLAEVMNYPGTIAGDADLLEKIADAKAAGRVCNGHAPLLTGKDLDTYISRGIYDDHECTSYLEGRERIRKGQTLMIRQGTTARNVDELLDLFNEPYSHSCMLVSDDRNAQTLLKHGDIDHIIRLAISMGKNAVTGIRMATLTPARHFHLNNLGAIAPGYLADIIVLEDLASLKVIDVFKRGKLVVCDGDVLAFDTPSVDQNLFELARNSFHIEPTVASDFALDVDGMCHVIVSIPEQIITEACEMEITAPGPDPERDLAKIAVLERHHNTGQRGIGFVCGLGLKEGAIASSVSHDSHNLIVAGMDDESMATAANCLIEMGGGQCVVKNGKVIAKLALPIAGLMSDDSIENVARDHQALRDACLELGVGLDRTPFMTLSFISLPVIPFLKITARGLVDSIAHKRINLKVN